MRGVYQWLTVGGKRVFRTTDVQSGDVLDIPFDEGWKRVNKTLYGAQSAEELAMAKVVNDRNSMDEKRRWLEGPVADQTATIDAYRAEIVRLRELAGLDPETGQPREE